jgi:putative ABC transport system ATP-binding protein
VQLIQQLAQDHKKTVLLVTHDPLAAERAHSILHLDKGVLVEAQTAGSRA